MVITGHVMKSSKLRVSSRWCPSSESLSWGFHDANFTGGFIVDISNYLMGVINQQMFKKNS